MTKKTKWIIGASVLVIALGFGAANAETRDDTSPTATPTVEAMQPVAPAAPAAAAPEPTVAPVVDLAARTQAALFDNLGGITAFTELAGTESPLYAIASIEDVSAGTIRVNYQNPLDKAGRDLVAKHVFQLAGITVTDLDTVIIRDTSGRDSNHYRRDIPMLNG